ncbi:twin-arginine translocation signal domain-containing protein [Selenomonas ruminis]|uniref:Twin-arginine translocation signal domain-containing protein n=1 Tax=Selenomonas ruminis TaxID=2593411 RepID=A0A5D6WBD0_9FIRM|nr:twin-arginine translocation signal domain-containing protein [Selenomonas sp. mPRGC5]TYZ25110.1 twin-arginine translocation signal domain-containing protein [Selenomonas sp. mPRGC5]
MEKRMSRRKFVKLAGAALAVVALPCCRCLGVSGSRK